MQILDEEDLAVPIKPKYELNEKMLFLGEDIGSFYAMYFVMESTSLEHLQRIKAKYLSKFNTKSNDASQPSGTNEAQLAHRNIASKEKVALSTSGDNKKNGIASKENSLPSTSGDNNNKKNGIASKKNSLPSTSGHNNKKNATALKEKSLPSTSGLNKKNNLPVSNTRDKRQQRNESRNVRRTDSESDSEMEGITPTQNSSEILNIQDDGVSNERDNESEVLSPGNLEQDIFDESDEYEDLSWQLFPADYERPVVPLRDGSRINIIRSVKRKAENQAKTGQALIRKYTAGIFTEDAIKKCTISGDPTGCKGREEYERRAPETEYLHPNAVEELFDVVMDQSKRRKLKGYKTLEKAKLHHSMSDSLSFYKRVIAKFGYLKLKILQGPPERRTDSLGRVSRGRGRGRRSRI